MQPSLENGAPKSTRQTSNVTADDYVGLAMAAGAGGGAATAVFSCLAASCQRP